MSHFTPWPGSPPPAGGGGSGGDADEVFFTYYLVTETVANALGTHTPGVSFVSSEPVAAGFRSVVILDGGGYDSFVGDGTETMLYEDPQLSTFAKSLDDLGGQSVMLNVYADFTGPEMVVNTLYLMVGDELVPAAATDENGAPVDLVLYVAVTGDVDIATLEAGVDQAAGTLFAVGVPLLMGTPQASFPGGTVTGGAAPGIYESDGTNLTLIPQRWEQALARRDMISFSGVVVDGAGADVAVLPPAVGTVYELDSVPTMLLFGVNSQSLYISSPDGTGNLPGTMGTVQDLVNAVDQMTLKPLTLAELVAAADASELTPRRIYFVTDVGLGMAALASAVDTYEFLGTLSLDHDDPLPTGYIGHYTRTPAP